MATFAEFWLKPFKAAASTAAVRGQHWRISCDDASMLLTAQESRSHRFLIIEVANTVEVSDALEAASCAPPPDGLSFQASPTRLFLARQGGQCSEGSGLLLSRSTER